MCETLAVRIQVAVPRSAGKPARSAHLELRYAKVELKAPAHKTKYLGLDMPLLLLLWLVVAKEVNSPEGVEAVCWRVWTTVEIDSGEQAVDWIARLGGYLNRKCGGPQGAQVLWRGLRRLEDITLDLRLLTLAGLSALERYASMYFESDSRSVVRARNSRLFTEGTEVARTSAISS